MIKGHGDIVVPVVGTVPLLAYHKENPQVNVATVEIIGIELNV